MLRFLIGMFAALLTLPASAGWQLNNDLSQISFVSTKAGNVAEVHRFGSLTGTVTAQGDATVEIDLVSVDTSIGIRDERMRELLFETGSYPLATLLTAVDLKLLESLAAGTLHTTSQEVTVNLHGQQQVLTTEVLVTRVAPDRFLVTSVRPVIVMASQFQLVDGIEKLREVAGLPSISQSVPVSFQLVFDLKKGSE